MIYTENPIVVGRAELEQSQDLGCIAKYPELQAYALAIEHHIAVLQTEITRLEQQAQELLAAACSVAVAALQTLQEQPDIANTWHQVPRSNVGITNQITLAVAQATQVLSNEAVQSNQQLALLKKQLILLKTYRAQLELTGNTFASFVEQLAQIESLSSEEQLQVLLRFENLRVTQRFLDRSEETPFVPAQEVLKAYAIPNLNDVFTAILRPYFQQQVPTEGYLYEQQCGLVLLQLLQRLGVPLKFITKKYATMRQTVTLIGTAAGEPVPPVFAKFVAAMSGSILKSFAENNGAYSCSMVRPELRLPYAQLLGLPIVEQTV